MLAPTTTKATHSDQSQFQQHQSQSYFSNLFSYLPTTQSLTQRLNAWYETAKDTAHYYLEDDPIIYSPKNYFPEDIQILLVQNDELTELKPQANWFMQQFRMAFYKGLMQVTQNQIEPKEWLNKLESFKSILPDHFVNQVFPTLEKIYNKYFKDVEQHATTIYQVPVSVYRELFTTIEKEFIHKKMIKTEENKIVVQQNEQENNSFPLSVKKIFNWIWNHKTEAFTLGLVATAFYKFARLSEENNFAPINFVSNVAIAFGTQHIIQSQGNSFNSFSRILLPALFSLIQPAQSQNTTFLETLGGENDDEGYALAVSEDGEIIVSGQTLNFGARGADVFLTKVWQNGTFVWAKIFGGTSVDVGTALTVSQDGGIIVAGFTDSFGAGGSDVFLAKVWQNGSLVWVQTLGGTSNDMANALTVSQDGGIIVAGSTDSFGAGNSDVFLAKVWQNGTFVWAKALGGTNDDEGYALSESLDGYVIVAGFTDSFGAGDYDVFLAKVWQNGTFVWAKTLGGTNFDWGYALIMSQDGGFIVAGETESFGAGKYDVFLAKIWQDGTLAWAQTMGGTDDDAGSALTVSQDEGIIVAGSTDSFGRGKYDAFLVKVWQNGTFAWAKTLGGTRFDEGTALNVLQEGGIIVAGVTESFGAGNEDVFLAKLDNTYQLNNCSYLATINPTVLDVTSSVNASSPEITFQDWSNITVQNPSITENFVDPTVQQDCPTPPTPVSTPNPTPTSTNSPTPSPTPNINTTSTVVPTTSGSTSNAGPTISTSSLSTTSSNPSQPLNNSSSTYNNTVPIAIGATLGGVALLGLGIGGAACFFKKYKKPKLGSEHKKSQNIELREKQIGSANSSNPQQYAEMSDVISHQQSEPIIYANATATPQSGNQYLPFIALPNKPKLSIYTAHVARDVTEKYDLLYKINRAQAKLLKEQTGLEVVFSEGVEETDVILGKGQFGELRIALSKDTNSFVCVKKIKGEKAIEDSLLEAQKQKKLAGLPYIMPLSDSIPAEEQDKPVLYQFMPLAGFGNGEFLREILAACEDQVLKDQILAQVMYGLLTGFKDMHSKNIFHMDFKPPNFVIDQWGDVYIIDFGCAIELENGLIQGSLGDSNYFSPERLSSYRSPKEFEASKSDGWAIGLTLLELALNRSPFDTCSAKEKITAWDEVYFKDHLSKVTELQDADVKSFWIVIKGLLAVDPQKRLSVNQALNMPIFTEVKLQFASKEEGKKQMSRLKEIAQGKVKIKKTESVPKKDDKNYTSAHPEEKAKLHDYKIAPSQINNSDYQISQDLKLHSQNVLSSDVYLYSENGKVMRDDKAPDPEYMKSSNIQTATTQNFFSPADSEKRRSIQNPVFVDKEGEEPVYPENSEFKNQQA